jgi:transcriptional regulator with XRE-family HTH domain
VIKDRTAEVLRHVGANVRRKRIQKGLTQAELAEAIDVDVRYLQRIERATTVPSISTVVALADTLETPVSMMFQPAKLSEPKTGRPRKRRSRQV